MKPKYPRHNAEHWITCRIAYAVWMYAAAAEFDGMTGWNSQAWIPHTWGWKRPRVERFILAVTRPIAAVTWRVVEWHMRGPLDVAGKDGAL